MSNEKLGDLRAKIDELDLQLLNLLNQRMGVSLEIGRLKTAENQNTLDRVREEEILERLKSLNFGPILLDTLDAVYREIFSGSRALQRPLTIAYLGPAGTHTHDAVLQRFGTSHPLSPCTSVREVFEQVAREMADFGVVPVENSIEGSVRETLDSLMTTTTVICGEIHLRIRHALVTVADQMGDIRRVISHPQALAQCRQWLARNLPGVGLQESSSTAKAAEMALLDSSTAAIASENTSKRLGLKVIIKDIQDIPENFTRFLVLGRIKPAVTGRDKTCMVFWTEDRPGALYNILKGFSMHDINLSRIESRPDRGAGPWKYAFFVDLEGHSDEKRVATCLKEIEMTGTRVKVLGSFPVDLSAVGESS